jgi:ferredoxin
MRVWIDQDLCTGDAQCVEIASDIFFGHDDGFVYRCYVRDAGQSGVGRDGRPVLQTTRGSADVPESLEDAVIHAAEYCPGNCIFIELS